tara:strand:- start:3447 stop:3719 length:273 start_codon:yes stop_codon:yes gene_type:complete
MLVLLFVARLPFVAASSLCAVLRLAFALCPLRFCFSKSTLANHPQHEEKTSIFLKLCCGSSRTIPSCLKLALLKEISACTIKMFLRDIER